MSETIAKEIGQRVRESRKAQQLTQEDLADRANLSRGTIANIETGIQEPSVSALIRIAAALTTNPGALLGKPDAELVTLPKVTIRRVPLYDVECELCGIIAEDLGASMARDVRANHIRNKHWNRTTEEQP